MTDFVLIAGIGCGSWAWQPVARLLREAGHRTLPITLPGLGFADEDAAPTLSDAVGVVVEAVRAWTDQPVTVLAHSWGGIPATGVAVRLGVERVDQVVYFGGVVVEDGQSMRDQSPEQAAMIDAALQSAHLVPVPFEAVAFGMLQDEPEIVQRLTWQLVKPMPGRYLTDPLEDGAGALRRAGIPTRYLLAEADQALAVPGDEFAARAGARSEPVPGNHMSMFVAPEPFVRVLLDARAAGGRLD